MTRRAPATQLGIIGCGNVMGAYAAAISRLRARGLAEVAIAADANLSAPPPSRHSFSTVPGTVRLRFRGRMNRQQRRRQRR